ncbi:MAG: site-2 protease family protein [Halobacteriaceae archaeon]
MPTAPADAPDPERIGDAFQVYEVVEDGERILYLGDPIEAREDVVQSVWPVFQEAGYDVSLAWRESGFVLVATPIGNDRGIPWKNAILLALTIVTTMWAGTGWYYVREIFVDGFPWISPSVIEALPFTLAVLGVLGTHEMGHYVMSRYHDVNASLPYFIPMIPPFGTIGAVIRMRGRIPDRKALFDIGVAGPLAGLVATILVTAIGLMLPPVEVPAWVFQGPNIAIDFGYPPLLIIIAEVLGEPLSYQDPRTVVNPVVLGGWIGMFVTFLNLIPVGQLDGGHITRAILGERQERLAKLVPVALFGLAGYLYFIQGTDQSVGIWVLWGGIATVFSYAGSANPVVDEPLERRRVAIGLLTLFLGLLCFTPVPVTIGGP